MSLNPAIDCPRCNGTGKAFRQVDADHRVESVCPDYNGERTEAAALYGVLTGEAQKRREEVGKDQAVPWYEVEYWPGHRIERIV